MDMFDSLLEESRFVRKKTAEAKVEGTIETLRQVIIEFVQARFPSLADLAQQKVMNVSEPQRLHKLIMQLATISNEEAAQKLLQVLDV